MGDPHVAIGYLRVSTDKQHLGPDAQKAAIEAWASANGVRVAAWHTDPDVSGGSELEHRPGLIAAIAALRLYKAGVLAVARRDRLARGVEVAIALERAIRSAGACVASADGRNDEGPSGKLIRQIEDALAEHERELVRVRTRGAMDVLKQRGLSAGNPPYGFRIAKDGARSKNGRVIQLEPDPYEQDVCARVMRMREMGFTEAHITYELRWSVKSRRGHALDQSRIHAILKNCARLRKIFPNHARTAPARTYACARGHVYNASMDGRYCLRDACKDGRGDGSPQRRIELR
jgi:DNA invertase Pin-like site-specific DNA recombinase